MQPAISNTFHRLKENKLFWFELLFIWFKCYELELIMGLVFFMWFVLYRGDRVFRFCCYCTIFNETAGLWNFVFEFAT